MGVDYKIFGAGPGGLYTAWRLITGGKLTPEDSVELVEWGDYSFTRGEGTRQPAGRICSYHHQGDPTQSYIEVGGMRFEQWNNEKAVGHFLVSWTVEKLGLKKDVVPFLTTTDPLFYLRGEAFYQSELEAGKAKAPYNTGQSKKPASALYTEISKDLEKGNTVGMRSDDCNFYATGKLQDVNSFVYRSGDVVSNIGYWNFFYDQAGNEGFHYAADAGGYSSNAINWNAANAAIYNDEFTPGGAFVALAGGYSRLFVELFQQTKVAASQAGIAFMLSQKQRLHSIWLENGAIRYRTASASDPFTPGAVQEAGAAFLAMPKHSIELIAQATRYADMTGKSDFLNTNSVQLALGSVIEQPSYKIAMFFDTQWWLETKYPPHLMNPSSTTKGDARGKSHVYGPTITDLPLRQIYYFGDNAAPNTGAPVYGVLASYDDMRFTQFWQELELPANARRQIPLTRNYQALEAPAPAPSEMERMLRLQLAKVHYGDADAAALIPAALETVYMDWSLNPFGAGYHAWAAHYDICDVMQSVRNPTKLAGGAAAPVYIVGSAYSNDQAWVEGAFCTAESVLHEFLHYDQIAPNSYQLICGPCKKSGKS